MNTTSGSQFTVTQRQTFSMICLGTVLIISLFFASSVVLTTRLSHDEHMYLSAARLLDRGTIYADFAYLQSPYMPFVYHFAMNIINSEYILLIGRIVKVVIVMALLLVFFRLTLYFSSDKWFSLACFLILLENNIFRHTIGYARNYDLPMLLVLLAGWKFVSLRSYATTKLSYAIAGLLVGLAIGSKLTYVIVPFAFIFPILIEYGIGRRSLPPIALFSLGLAIGLMPAIYLCLDAGIDGAFFNNIGFHNLNAIWYAESDGTISFIDKLRHMKQALWTLPTQFIFLLELLVLALIVTEKHSIFSILKTRSVLWCATLVVVSIFIFLVPTPVWLAYYSPFVIWSTLLVATLYSQVSVQARTTVKILAFACVFMLLIFHFPDDFRLSWAAFHPANWPCVRVHTEGLALRSAIPVEYLTRPVATLSPIYALEADLDIYPELSTGPFTYRIGGLLSTGCYGTDNHRQHHTIYGIC
ncbi:MAG: hypothetical protein KJ922_03475 [Nanoarchaeota archaeon]|nr:hypothetical protein [Nanoarchaeota archaeon]